ncbi:hypothetical protein ACWFRM_00705 [Streptomyces sp. NPDC055144]
MRRASRPCGVAPDEPETRFTYDARGVHTAASRYAAIAQNLQDDQTGVRRDAVGRESGRS